MEDQFSLFGTVGCRRLPFAEMNMFYVPPLNLSLLGVLFFFPGGPKSANGGLNEENE